ncbi:MAG: hypothetical protein N3A02_06225 [Rectinema sp.]|nr:hypothetical protein [Rectinema sp.]
MKEEARKRRELKFIHTGRRDEAGTWYALDNAGIIMPAMANEYSTGMFRFEAELEEPIELESMQNALALTVRRMPYFNVRLRRGFFWYYFEPCEDVPPLYTDSPSPCQGWNINSPGTRMFRVRCHGRRVAGEFNHALTDGTGGMTFLRTLLANYFLIQGIKPGASSDAPEWKDILTSPEWIEANIPLLGKPPREVKPGPNENPEEEFPAEEFEDAYQRYFPKGLPVPDLNPKAFHIRSNPLPKGQYRLIRGELSAAEALAEAKRRFVTLTELMTAVYLDALQQLWHQTVPRPREHFVTVEVPINLRSMFPSRTYRNFSLFVLIGEDMRLGMRTFDDLVRRTHYQMKLEYDRMSIARHLARNAGSARLMAVRMVPLFLKDFFARAFFSHFGEAMLSGFISNLGPIIMPPGFAPHIRRFGFIPAPSPVLSTNASVLTWADRLIVDFGSLVESRDLERLFFWRLRSLGLRVRVTCRLDHTEEESDGVLS